MSAIRSKSKLLNCTPLKLADPLTLHKAVESARHVMSCIQAGDAKAAEEGMRRHINIVDLELNKEFPAKK